MPRADWQRQKVYDAESRFNFYDLSSDHYLRSKIGLDVDQVIAITGEVFDAVEEATGFRGRLTEVDSSRGYRVIASAFRHSGKMKVNPQYATPLVIIHEACHLATLPMVPGHGVEFAENMVIAIRAIAGDECAASLVRQFKLLGVAHSYQSREAYTRKRARWAAREHGEYLNLILRRDREEQGRTIQLMHKFAVRRPEGLLVRGMGVGVGSGGEPTSEDVLIPYDMVAYVERTFG